MNVGATTDVLVVGAGLAGLFLALRLAPRRCTVLSPTVLGQAAASAWAQGGLAAALDPADSPEQHAADTIAAGAGLVDPQVALLIAREGPAAVAALANLGVPFDRTQTERFALSLEAAHSQARVARVAGDLAGRAIMETLVTAVRRATHIQVLEGVRAVALAQTEGRVTGVMTRSTEGESLISAAETVMATGGAGGLYRITTNPKEARGAALAQAFNAGAVIADPEFVQFHPTALDVAADPAPLATESLRGEGSRLINADGTAFMSRYHPQGDLAPRDVVARAIHAERMAARGAFLDCRASIGADFPTRFPTVFSACQRAGFDPREQPIPVAPAAHYHMGGIATDSWGRSTVTGLSACGECA
ncbi:MAG: L-aspartate oxidase, partial [Pseudomonadota bacterium]